MTDAKTGKGNPWRRFAVTMLIWAIIGAAFGFFLRPVSELLGLDLNELDRLADRLPDDGSFVAAGCVGLLYVAFGLFGAAIVARPSLASNDGGLGGREDVAENRVSYLWQSIAMTAAGAALLALILSEPIGAIAPPLGLAIFAASMALFLYAYWRSWQMYDELLRAMTLEASAFSYFVMLAIGGGWAAMGHLGLTGGPDGLDWLTLFWTMGIVSALWAAGKRGMITEDSDTGDLQ